MRAAAAKLVSAAVSKQDLPALEAALSRLDGPPPAQAVMNAGRLAWMPGLRLLLRRGADLNASFKNYRAIHALIQEKPHEGGASTPERIACLQWLIENGADPDQLGAWPAARSVIVAAFGGDRNYVDALLKLGARRDIFTAAALGDAVRTGKLLSSEPALATARDGGFLTALQCAAGSRLGVRDAKTAAGLLASARLLIDAGADVNASTKSWAHEVAVSYFAIRSGQIDMLRLLVERGLNTTEAIAAAAWEKRGDMLDLLIASGADLARARDHVRPVLNELVRWGQFDAARLYLSKGVDPNLADDKGWTSMHQVVSRGNLRMVKDLVAAGGDANRPDEDGRTPRGMAKKRGRADLIAAMGG